MFAGRTAKVVTIACAIVGVVALLFIFFLSATAGSEYTEFILAMVFFLAFLVGAYWWIVFGPGGRM